MNVLLKIVARFLNFGNKITIKLNEQGGYTMKNSILFSMISLMSFSIASAQRHQHSSSAQVKVQVNLQSSNHSHHSNGNQLSSCNHSANCNQQKPVISHSSCSKHGRNRVAACGICNPPPRVCNHGNSCLPNRCNHIQQPPRSHKACKPAAIRNCPAISCNFQGGHKDCGSVIMDNDRFYSSLNVLKCASFDSDRLILAKNIANSNSLSSWQIREMLLVFSFESSRVEFAKYAYSSCADPENYVQIQDAFQYSSSISEVF